jgi:hypothetical protein
LKINDHKILLLLTAFAFSISIAAEPLAHDHYEEDHAEENCLICNLNIVSFLDEYSELITEVHITKEFKGTINRSYQLTYSFPYSTRAPPKI